GAGDAARLVGAHAGGRRAGSARERGGRRREVAPGLPAPRAARPSATYVARVPRNAVHGGHTLPPGDRIAPAERRLRARRHGGEEGREARARARADEHRFRRRGAVAGRVPGPRGARALSPARDEPRASAAEDDGAHRRVDPGARRDAAGRAPRRGPPLVRSVVARAARTADRAEPDGTGPAPRHGTAGVIGPMAGTLEPHDSPARATHPTRGARDGDGARRRRPAPSAGRYARPAGRRRTPLRRGTHESGGGTGRGGEHGGDPGHARGLADGAT